VLPDLIVAGPIDLDDPVVDADAVRLVCEVVSPASAVLDRVLKMHAYAAAGIPCYLVAEPDRGSLHSHELRGDTYVTGSVMQLAEVTSAF
jgi:Uma2 family endonuclease